MDMADNSTYSVVDKTKKNRYSPEKTAVENADSETPVYYSVVSNNENNVTNDVDIEDSKGTYSMIRLPPSEEEETVLPVANSIIHDERAKVESVSNRKFICILVALGIVTLVAIACFIAVFYEISRLKMMPSTASEMSLTSDSPLGVYLEQLSRNLSNLDEKLITSLSRLDARITSVTNQLTSLDELFAQNTPPLSSIVVISCAALPPSSPSGYYWVRASNGSAVRVYCDMTTSCGGVTGGWMRVTELDITNSSQQCPGDLEPREDSGIHTCVRKSASGGCASVEYTANVDYSRVCGRIIAYQIGSTDAFRSNDINSNYVDGVSLTHGSPRQHIWTFAAALDRTGNNCPCQNTPVTSPPSFVGTDYFCDSGNEQYMDGEFGLQPDPLWDGAGCLCCTDPPWFYKQLSRPTTDDIEMRVCRNQHRNNEDIAIQVVEVYVQ